MGCRALDFVLLGPLSKVVRDIEIDRILHMATYAKPPSFQRQYRSGRSIDNCRDAKRDVYLLDWADFESMQVVVMVAAIHQ